MTSNAVCVISHMTCFYQCCHNGFHCLWHPCLHLFWTLWQHKSRLIEVTASQEPCSVAIPIFHVVFLHYVQLQLIL